LLISLDFSNILQERTKSTGFIKNKGGGQVISDALAGFAIQRLFPEKTGITNPL